MKWVIASITLVCCRALVYETGTQRPGLAECPKLWDGSSVLGDDGGHQCFERVMIDPGSALGGGKEPSMCVRNYHDSVSDAVKAAGYWPDCPVLTQLWLSLPNNAARVDHPDFRICPGSGRPANSKKLFVEVGANIGACTAQMLARPDVDMVVAYEPNPANLFYLTSTIMKNNFKSKIALYPVGLGEVAANLPIYEETHWNEVQCIPYLYPLRDYSIGTFPHQH